MIGRVVVHGERRAREMEEVAETLRSLDIEPIMAEAIVRRMDWSAQLGLKQPSEAKHPRATTKCWMRSPRCPRRRTEAPYRSSPATGGRPLPARLRIRFALVRLARLDRSRK